MARYTKLYSSIWEDDKFRALDDSAQKLFTALISVPSCNMIGYYSFPKLYAMHDLNGWTEEMLIAKAKDVSRLGLAHYDLDNDVVLVTNFLKYNTLTSITQIQGGIKVLKDVPPSFLMPIFRRAWEHYVYEPFRDALPKKLEEAKDERARLACEKQYAQVLRYTEQICIRANAISKVLPMPPEIAAVPLALDNRALYEEMEIQDALGHTLSDTLSNTLSHAPSAQKNKAEAEEGSIKQKPKQQAPPVAALQKSGGGDNAPLLSSIKSLWQEILVPAGLPPIVQMTQKRREALLARIGDDPERKSVEWWRELFLRIADTTYFPRAIAEKQGQWITFDWIMTEKNFVALIEGKYDGDRQSSARAGYAIPKDPNDVLRELRRNVRQVGHTIDMTDATFRDVEVSDDGQSE